MSKKKKKRSKPDSTQPVDADKFGLSLPTDEIESLRIGESKSFSDIDVLSAEDHYISTEKHLHDAEAKYKAMGWKGIDDEEDEELEDAFRLKKEPIPEDELDMTPMVDVTFLLLIFFMVTASFALQKSIQQPPAKIDEASSNVLPDEEIVEDYVEVLIDQNNNYYVTTRDEAEKEAPSEREMRSRLKDAKDSSNASRLVIKAHLDCKHSKVVTAWDAGIAVGINKIQIQTTEQDF